MPLTDMVIKSSLDNIFSHTGKERKVNDHNPSLYFSTLFLGPGSLHLKSHNSILITKCYPGYKL